MSVLNTYLRIKKKNTCKLFIRKKYFYLIYKCSQFENQSIKKNIKNKSVYVYFSLGLRPIKGLEKNKKFRFEFYHEYNVVINYKKLLF